ncbi:MAG: hypothetical protein PHE17_20000 [Thiothrix sp.]|uniref:hypothetical protein n=1 Tax=Thiothrix sp. TaxID=1032 RepID=UPI00260A77DF|nr:hypothetical protein [Thiothrix sp.]MDD5395313.1 hypothetical protein [Thiothrix sp.]
MNRIRFILTVSFAACLAIAAVALATPFFASLGISATAIADLPRVAIPALQAGDGKNLSGKVEDMVRVAGMEAAGILFYPTGDHDDHSLPPHRQCGASASLFSP